MLNRKIKSIIFISLIILLPFGCKEKYFDDSSPEGAVKLFMQSWVNGNNLQIYNLLSSKTKRSLRKTSDEIRKNYKVKLDPWNLIVTEKFTLNYQDYKIKVKNSSKSEAKVNIIANNIVDNFDLFYEDGHWRIYIDLNKIRGDSDG